MRNFQGIVFIGTQKYNGIFKSALVYLCENLSLILRIMLRELTLKQKNCFLVKKSVFFEILWKKWEFKIKLSRENKKVLSLFYRKKHFWWKMNVRHPMGVLHLFSIKNILHDKIDLRLFLFSCDKILSN